MGSDIMNPHAKKKGDLIDSGRTKWTSLMLSEHVSELRKWYGEDDKTPQTTLNEFDLQLIGEEIDRAYKSREEVRIKTWQYGYVKQCRGTIIHVNPHYLMYEDPFGEHICYLRDIIDVEVNLRGPALSSLI